MPPAGYAASRAGHSFIDFAKFRNVPLCLDDRPNLHGSLHWTWRDAGIVAQVGQSAQDRSHRRPSPLALPKSEQTTMLAAECENHIVFCSGFKMRLRNYVWKPTSTPLLPAN
jgi:hypothetical protein